MKALCTLFGLGCLFWAVSAGARIVVPQSRQDAVLRQAELSGIVTDSVTGGGLPGAVVAVIFSTDTMRCAAGEGGRFRCRVPIRDAYELEVSFLGYVSRQVSGIPRKQLIDGKFRLQLVPQAYEMDSVTVKGEVPVMTMKGDTAVYHAAAVRTMVGDNAGELIGRLPGIEVNEEGVTALGKKVSRTLVDGTTLFGSDPLAPLENLDATDVNTVEVYDMQRSFTPPGDQDEDERIMNIHTFSRLDRAITGELLGTLGKSYGSEGALPQNDRYGAGATFNYFTLDHVANVDFMTDNNDRTSNSVKKLLDIREMPDGYRKKQQAHVRYEGQGKLSVATEYEYRNRTTIQNSIGLDEYLPTSEYVSRIYEDTLQRFGREREHIAHLNLGYGGKVRLFSKTDFRHTRSADEDSRFSASLVDGAVLGRSAVHTPQNHRGYSLSEMLDISWESEDEKTNLGIRLGADLEKGNRDGWRIDTLASSAARTYLQIGGNGWNRVLEGSLELERKVSHRSLFSAGYRLKSERGKSLRMALSRDDRQVDSTDSYDYTNRFVTHTPGLRYRYRHEKWLVNIVLDCSLTATERDEHFFPNDDYRKNFRSVQPSVSLMYFRKPFSRFQFYYRTYTVLPGLEMLSRRLDTRNPLSLSTGNPALKQSYTHSFGFSYQSADAEKARFFQIEGGWKYTVNAYAFRSQLFTEDAFYDLPTGPYLIPKGAMLTTTQNVDGVTDAFLTLRLSKPLKPLRSMLDLRLAGTYGKAPFYRGERLIETERVTPALTLGLKSNFSSDFRIDLATSSAYLWGRSDAYTGAFSQTVSAGLRFNFFKRCYFNTNYRFRYYAVLRGPGENIRSNILNLMLGCRLFKSGRGNICIVAYDVLDEGNNAQYRVLRDHVHYGWTNTVGRYYSLNLGYRFNITRKGKLPDYDFE